MARLGDICKINMGQSPDSSTYNNQGIGMPFYQGNADFGVKYPSPRMYCSNPVKVAQKGDILISVRAPIGALNMANDYCCIGRGLAAITANEDVCYTRYLWYSLLSRVEELNTRGTGSTFKAISRGILDTTEIPLPPINEQRTISAKLDKAYDLILLRKKQMQKLDNLIKARFVEMFGNPDLGIIKPEWKTISSIGTVVGGATPKTTIDDYWDGEYRWITPAELDTASWYIYDSVRKITEAGVKSCSLTEMPAGTVILSSRAPIGKVAIAGNTFYCNQGFKNIICGDKVHPVFLYALLVMNNDYLNSLGRGATFKEISKSIVENIKRFFVSCYLKHCISNDIITS